MSSNSQVTESPGRPARNRIKPKKYNNFMEISPRKKIHQDRTDAESEDDSEHSSDNAKEVLKPRALFCNDDIEGQDMFKFKSRRTKNDLQNKVKNAISNSPKAAASPINTLLKKSIEATPRHVKEKMKKRIVKEIEISSDEGDFSGSSSGSDFVPEDESNEESAKSSESSESEEEQSVKKVVKVASNKLPGKNVKESDYFVTPDNYFMMNSSKKITTSDHTLARLKNVNLNQSKDGNSEHISTEHRKVISDLNQSYEHLFDRWLYVLSENCNIILYGVGSKRYVLHQFQSQRLKDFPCVVINGFFPSLTIKSILETIVVDLFDNTHVPNTIGDVIALIDNQLKENDTDLFLIVHNIDGAVLRNSKAQTMLASLSQIENVHMIASIDHINGPLLWDHTKLSKFKFTWWDVTTFMPYTGETSFENSILAHRSGTLQISSLKSVYQSLTTNSKGIFNIIIQYQLENQKQANYQGLSFKDLYSKCREQFLVSSDDALRAQMTEFLDHKLVKTKRTYDASENLIIPIENTLLQEFLEQQNS